MTTKIGFIASCFDLGPHAGHVEYIKFARSQCDYLVAGLHVDPSHERQTKNKPVLTISERFITLSANKFIDEVIPYETEAELIELMLLKNINIRFLGSDYQLKDFTGKDITHIKIIYFDRIHNISSSGLRKKLSALGV